MAEMANSNDGEYTGISADGFIRYQQFVEGCSALVDRCHRKCPAGGLAFDLLGTHECQYLATLMRLRSSVRDMGANSLPLSTHDVYDDGKSADLDYDEPLDEAAIHHACISEQSPTVEYHVLHAPSYQVPILYLRLNHLLPHDPKGLDAVYEWLVPQSMKKDIRSHGILGGIGIGNHPVTGHPAYFVHPCNTAEALRHVTGGRICSPLEYLQIWFGLVGPAVGLYLPKEMFVDT